MIVRFLVTTWVSLAIATAMVGCGGSGSSSSGTTSTTGGTTTAGAGGSTGSTSGSTTGTGGNGTTTTGSTTTTTTTSAGQGGFGGNAAGGDCGKCVTDGNIFAPGSDCAKGYQACAQDPTCNDFLTCADQCLLEVPQTAQCWVGCEQAAQAVLALYQPFVACICGACKADCSAACP